MCHITPSKFRLIHRHREHRNTPAQRIKITLLYNTGIRECVRMCVRVCARVCVCVYALKLPEEFTHLTRINMHTARAHYTHTHTCLRAHAKRKRKPIIVKIISIDLCAQKPTRMREFHQLCDRALGRARHTNTRETRRSRRHLKTPLCMRARAH